MTQHVAQTPDLDQAAQRLAAVEWGMSEAVERVNVGMNKATWRVGKHWLACDYPRAAAQVERMRTILATLTAHPGFDLAVPRFVAGHGGYLVHSHGRVWWLTEHVAGRQPDPDSPTDTAAVAAGLARLHTTLRDLPASPAASADNAVCLFEAGARLARDPRLGFTPADHDALDEAIAVVRRRLDALGQAGIQLVHGDPSNPNLRVRDDPLRLTGALDWDHARLDLALADVATVAQTVVLRSGSAAPLDALNAMLDAYLAAGGVAMTLDDLLIGLVMAKFESIAHHGGRYLRGESGQAIVRGQVDKIRTILDLHTRE